MIYFDDLSVGEIFESPGRTVTETDIVMFAGLTGDYNDIHMNAERAKKRAFGQRVAHGLLVLTLTRGLLFRTALIGADTELAFLGIPEVIFKSPVFIGDTVSIKATVQELSTKSPDAVEGVVLLRCEAINQDGKVAQESFFKLLMARRPTTAA